MEDQKTTSNSASFVNGKSGRDQVLTQAVIQGRLETFRGASICSPLSEADFKEAERNYRYAWGIDYACHNGVIEKDTDRIPTEEEITKTIEYFSSKKLPFMWWSSAKILETKGLQFGGTLTGIALDISKNIPSKPSSTNLTIKIVSTASELKAFTDLASDAFGLKQKASDQWLDVNESVMKENEQLHLLAYLDNRPVGTVTLSTSASSAGIWNLGTSEEYRKHGIGGALVHAAIVEAKKRQYKQVFAILMPKGMAWGLFVKLGFKPVCEFPFYIYGISAEELEK